MDNKTQGDITYIACTPIEISKEFTIISQVGDVRWNSLVCNNGINPDFVMINYVKEESLKSEIVFMQNTVFYSMDSKNLHLFGMKVIFTDVIGEDEIICTYKNKR